MWLNERDIDRVAETGTCICHNCSSNFRLRSGVAALNLFEAKGVTVAIGLDEAGINDDRDMLQEMRMVLRAHRVPGMDDDVPTPAQVFRMATEDGAKTTPFGKHIGVLEVGRAADMVLIDWEQVSYPYLDREIGLLDAVVQRAKAGGVRTVLCAGEVIYDQGKFTKADRDGALAGAARGSAGRAVGRRGGAAQAVESSAAARQGVLRKLRRSGKARPVLPAEFARVTLRLLIRGGRVMEPGADAHDPPFRDILVEGDRIAAVGLPGTIEPASGDEILDASDRLVIPGFVNAHYHSYDVLAKGLLEDMPFDVWALHSQPAYFGPRSKAELRMRVLLGAIECLRNGITTLQDMNTLVPQDEETLDTILSAYEEVGIRVVFSVALRDIGALDIAPFLPDDVPPQVSVAHPGHRPGSSARPRVRRQANRPPPRPAGPHYLGPEPVRAATLLANLAGGHCRPVEAPRFAGVHSRL